MISREPARQENELKHIFDQIGEAEIDNSGLDRSALTKRMRTITNDYRDAEILDLGNGRETGPFLVTQTGVGPNDPAPKTHMFVLRPDGEWVDFNAYACKGKPEAMDELVFRTMSDVREVFGKLGRRPRVLELPIDKEGLKKWLERHEGRNPFQAAHLWAVEYRKRRRGKGR